MRLSHNRSLFLQELSLSEHLPLLMPGLTNLSALGDLRQLSLTKVSHPHCQHPLKFPRSILNNLRCVLDSW